MTQTHLIPARQQPAWARLNLAPQSGLRQRVDAMFNAEEIDVPGSRAVLDRMAGRRYRTERRRPA